LTLAVTIVAGITLIWTAFLARSAYFLLAWVIGVQ
jgi:hypothetical protein